MKFINEVESILYKSELTLEEKHRKIFHYAWEVFVDYKEYPFEDINFCDFVYSWKIFGSKLIPFELWSDICEEGLELIKKLLENPSIPYTELPGFNEFEIKKREKIKSYTKNA